MTAEQLEELRTIAEELLRLEVCLACEVESQEHTCIRPEVRRLADRLLSLHAKAVYPTAGGSP